MGDPPPLKKKSLRRKLSNLILPSPQKNTEKKSVRRKLPNFIYPCRKKTQGKKKVCEESHSIFGPLAICRKRGLGKESYRILYTFG